MAQRSSSITGLTAAAAAGLLAAALTLGGCASGSANLDPKQQDERRALAAAREGRQMRVTELLDEGVPLTAVDANGDTLLHHAAGNGHNELVAVLVGRGAVVSSTNAAGNTPLHLAAMRGHPKSAQALLAAGASKTARNNAGQTPADVAMPKVKGLLIP